MKKHSFIGLVSVGVLALGLSSARANLNSDDLGDASNPVMVPVQPPEWLSHDNPAIRPPDQASRRMSDQEQEACALKILKYVNDRFHTDFTEDNLAPIQLPNWKEATRGFVRGGGYNIRIRGYQALPADPDAGAKQRMVSAGRYMPVSGYVELGVHPSLHLPGSIGGYQTYTRKEVGNGEYLFDFVAHIDSADPWEPPMGSLVHLLRDVIGSSGRNPCPGSE